MPENISSELNFDQDWLLAIQPGQQFKEFVEVNQRGKSEADSTVLMPKNG